MRVRRHFTAVLAALACSAAFGAPRPASAGLEVVTLHPLMTDLARQVGGAQVAVSGLMKPGDDVHLFNPSSKDLALARRADVVLASGKGLERYLPKLKASLPPSVRVVHAGDAVPSITISSSNALFVCCPQHAAGSMDPHWWHSVSGMKKAAAFVAKEFGKADPANADVYRSNARAYGERLDALRSWAKREVAKVPKSSRTLVTAHAAFAYFCQEFGFRSIPVAGLSRDNTGSRYLAEAIEQIRKHEVPALFPEQDANPKALDSIVASTGARKGAPLIADGSVKGVERYEDFVRYNVSAVVAALGVAPAAR